MLCYCPGVLGGSEVVSIVAVVVAACGTVGSAVVTTRLSGWRDDRDRQHKAEEAAIQRREELVETAAYAVTNALHAFEQRRVSGADDASRRGLLFDDKVLGVALASTRVALYFPPGHEAVGAYEDAHAGLNILRAMVFEAEANDLGSAFADEEAKEVEESLKTFREAARPEKREPLPTGKSWFRRS